MKSWAHGDGRNPPEPTAELLDLAMAGEREAVATLARAFLPRVYGLCLRVSGERDVAEEATQETFVRALRALPRLRDRGRFRSWFLVIAANTARELVRARSSLAPLAAELAGELAAPGEGDAEAVQDRKGALERALARLEDEERGLFLRHTVDGVSIEDLARDRRTTVAAMKARVHRIRAKVRRAAHNLLRQSERTD